MRSNKVPMLNVLQIRKLSSMSDLADGHPFEIGANSVHLTLVESDVFTTELKVVLNERGLCIVLVCHTVAISVVSYFMIAGLYVSV